MTRRRRIKMIVPVPVPPVGLMAFADQFPTELCRPDIEIVFACADRGGATLDSYYEGTFADAFCLKAGLTAEAEGFSAVCINSMSDSGVAALRSRLRIPVIGTGQASYLAASLIGRRFSIISMWERWRWLYDKVLAETGLAHKLASIRSIDVRPDAAELLAGKEESVFPLLAEAGRKAIEEDGADVIILGSTTMHQSHRFLQDLLPVPVINPGLIALKSCEMLLDLGLSQSKLAYRPPEALNDGLLDELTPKFPQSGELGTSS